MSTLCSARAAGRPHGRPAVAALRPAPCLAALLAAVAWGAAAAGADAQQPATADGGGPVVTAPAPEAPAGPADPAPEDSVPRPGEAVAPPADPAPPPGEAVAPPPDPAPQPGEAVVPPADPVPQPGDSPAPSSAWEDGSGEQAPEQGAGARNTATVLQAIVQVQVGCRAYCRETTQTQSATQISDTTQTALALAGRGQSDGAVAVNEASTIQLIWQAQLGCVTFCWNTTLVQSATQASTITQHAAAVAAMALAADIADSIQHIWQLQEGCEIECHGVTEAQAGDQRAVTHQWTTGGSAPLAWDPDEPPSWLTALAESLGAVVETIFQYQEATCLSHCGEESIAQEATQNAQLRQGADATAAPAQTPPRQSARGAQPPGGPAAPIAATPNAGVRSGGGPGGDGAGHVAVTLGAHAPAAGPGAAPGVSRAAPPAAEETDTQRSERIRTGAAGAAASEPAPGGARPPERAPARGKADARPVARPADGSHHADRGEAGTDSPIATAGAGGDGRPPAKWLLAALLVSLFPIAVIVRARSGEG